MSRRAGRVQTAGSGVAGGAAQGRVFCRPLKAPVSASVKIRGWLTTAASSGCRSGTLITSIRHCVGLPVVTGSWVRAAFSQPASSAAGRTPDGTGVVDVDVLLVALAGDDRVGVRAAAGLHAGQLHGVVEVADVEDPHAAEAVGTDGRVRGEALRATVDPSPGLLHGHEQQVAVHRRVALPARAHERRTQRRVGRVGDVVDLEAVEAADDRVVTGEGEVGVDEPEVAGRRVERRHPWVVVQVVDVAAGLRPGEVAGGEADAWVFVGVRSSRCQHRDQEQHPPESDEGPVPPDATVALGRHALTLPRRVGPTREHACAAGEGLTWIRIKLAAARATRQTLLRPLSAKNAIPGGMVHDDMLGAGGGGPGGGHGAGARRVHVGLRTGASRLGRASGPAGRTWREQPDAVSRARSRSWSSSPGTRRPTWRSCRT